MKAEGEKTVAERVRLEAEDARVKAEGEKTVAERVRLVAEDAPRQRGRGEICRRASTPSCRRRAREGRRNAPRC